jgi:hypothetical protein
MSRVPVAGRTSARHLRQTDLSYPSSALSSAHGLVSAGTGVNRSNRILNFIFLIMPATYACPTTESQSRLLPSGLKKPARWPRSSRSGAPFRYRVLETRIGPKRGNVRQAATETCTPPRVEPGSAPCSPGLRKRPRRRNLWVTDTLQWAPEARLAQPRTRCGMAWLQLFLFIASCLSNYFALSGKRYAVNGPIRSASLGMRLPGHGNCQSEYEQSIQRVASSPGRFAPPGSPPVAQPTMSLPRWSATER